MFVCIVVLRPRQHFFTHVVHLVNVNNMWQSLKQSFSVCLFCGLKPQSTVFFLCVFFFNHVGTDLSQCTKRKLWRIFEL